jgi:thiosulfate dehydrogenase [quinone] large subunit
MSNTDKRLAYLVLRLALGLNIFIHGAERLFGGYAKFVDETLSQFANTGLPSFSVSMFGYAVPVIETLIGALLVLGLATRYATVVGSLLMIFLIFGMGILQKWEIVGLQMNYVFFYFLLLFFIEWNYFSADEWLLSKTKKR